MSSPLSERLVYHPWKCFSRPSRCARRPDGSLEIEQIVGDGEVCCQGTLAHIGDTLPAAPAAELGDRLRVSAGQQQVRHSAARPPSTPPRPKARSGSRSRIADRSRASMRQAARSSRCRGRRPVGRRGSPSRTRTGSLPARQASGSPTLPGARSGESIRRRTRSPSRSRYRSSRTCWPSTETRCG